MKPGIYTTLTNAEYHSGPGESKTLLDAMRRSPAHYAARVDPLNDNERAPTPSQILGAAFHAFLLEPQEFHKTHCVALRREDAPEAIDERDQLVAMVQELNAGRLAKLPTSGKKEDLVARIIAAYREEGIEAGAAVDAIYSLKTDELKAELERVNASRPGLLPVSGSRHELAALLNANGKRVTLWSDVKTEWEANNAHRQVLTQEQWEQLHRMRDAVMSHPAARALLTGAPGVAEQSVYWNDPSTGLLCRCRPDFWRADGIIVDVKTTEDASPEAFARSINTYRYHVQHAFYLDGVNTMRDQARADVAPAKAFLFLAVEKSARVVQGNARGVAVYALDEESATLGRVEYQQDLARIDACKRTNQWPGYSNRIESISLPQWKLAQSAHLLGQAA